MKQKSKQLKLIQKMVVLSLLVLLFILTTQTSAIAQPLTRAQIAVILGQGIHGNNFTPPAATGIFDDVSVNYLGADWIEQFYKDGITTGCGQNPLRYCPTNPVTRAQMAIFLLKSKHGKNYTPPPATGIFDDVPVAHWAADWIEQLYREKITSGCCTSPLLYCPDSSVTGIQMSLFIARTFGAPPAPVPKTGMPKEDRGVEWPEPRFTDNGDGTVIDNLTRLIWLKNADCFGALQYSEARTVTSTLADGQCGLTDRSSPGDWILPNIRELHSLIDYGCNDWKGCDESMLTPGHPFTGIAWPALPERWLYWTTTYFGTEIVEPGECIDVYSQCNYVVNFQVGGSSISERCQDCDGNTEPNGVWPVRGGN